MTNRIKIKEKWIGEGSPTYIIAEMSANHAGSIERAKEIIYAAKDAGADCIKIQTYTPDTMTIDCDREEFFINGGTWEGENLYKLYQKAYTPWEWQKELKDEAEKVGVDFFSTPFDKTSVDFLEEIGVEFYKIASFELIDIPLIKYIASKNKPIIMSCGMGTLGEIEEAIAAIRSQGNEEYALLKCSSAYPAMTDEMNLRTMMNMKDVFGVPVGLSDHSLGYLGATLGVACGASIVEKHFCLSREIEDPDSSFSMEPKEFREMVNNIRIAEKALGDISYGPTTQDYQSMLVRRSIFVTKDVKKGEPLTPENIRIIRPANGLAPKYYDDVLGKVALTDIERGTPLSFDLITQREFYLHGK